MTRREIKDLLSDLFRDLFGFDLTASTLRWGTPLDELGWGSEQMAELSEAIRVQEEWEVDFSEENETLVDLVDEMVEQIGE